MHRNGKKKKFQKRSGLKTIGLYEDGEIDGKNKQPKRRNSFRRVETLFGLSEKIL